LAFTADLDVVDGEKRTIHSPVSKITLVLVDNLVFMVPPGAESSLPVGPLDERARAEGGWREANLTVSSPFAVTADTQTLTLTQLPPVRRPVVRAGRSRPTPVRVIFEPRTVKVPAASVQGAKVRGELDVPATVGAALGITAGAAVLMFIAAGGAYGWGPVGVGAEVDRGRGTTGAAADGR